MEMLADQIAFKVFQECSGLSRHSEVAIYCFLICTLAGMNSNPFLLDPPSSCACVCVCVYKCMRRSENNLDCLPSGTFHSSLSAGSLTGLGLHHVLGQLTSELQGTLLSLLPTSPARGIKACVTMPAFYVGSGN